VSHECDQKIEVGKRWYRFEDYDALKDNLRRIIKEENNQGGE
jgi:hypothetical protein